MSTISAKLRPSKCEWMNPSFHDASYIYICKLRSSSRRHHLLFNWLRSFKCLHRQSGKVHAAAQLFRSSCWKNVCEERCVSLHRPGQVFSSSSAVAQKSSAVSPWKGGVGSGLAWLFSPAVQHLWASSCHIPGVCRVCQMCTLHWLVQEIRQQANSAHIINQAIL